MGLSTIVGSIALVPAALAVTLRNYVPLPVTLVLSHIAATGFVIAASATDRGSPYTTWLLGKDTDSGHISLLSHVVWWPYHLGLRGKLWVQWRRSTEPLFNKILPGIYLGGWPETSSALPAGNPSVLDVTCELPRTHDDRYMCIPTWDTKAPNADMIQQGIEWLQKEMSDDRPVYIHCAHGHGRSATVLSALLINNGQAKTAEEAVAIMRAARPRVRLNKNQAAALTSWIDKYASQPGSRKVALTAAAKQS
eukprot:jgi/Chrzof1/13123/Cz07g20210.t1